MKPLFVRDFFTGKLILGSGAVHIIDVNYDIWVNRRMGLAFIRNGIALDCMESLIYSIECRDGVRDEDRMVTYEMVNLKEPCEDFINKKEA